jgi:hypothetical protein
MFAEILPKEWYDTGMKTTRSILDNLRGQAHFRFLEQHRCYRQFLSMLPPRFQEAIGFVYVREATLYVALRHPGYKMELNYNKELLKSLLGTLIESDKGCRKLRADTVVFFNSKYTATQSATGTPATVPYYHELSEGTFEDHSSNPDLHEQFERLRQAIRINHQHDA